MKSPASLLESGRELLVLAERCEAATGPDRGLDCKIAEISLGWTACWATSGAKYQGDRPDGKRREIPRFTGSLDAALTLLDRYGVLMHLSDIGADGLPYARVGRPDLDGESIFSGISSGIAKDATPVSGLALALTAAALRARAAS